MKYILFFSALTLLSCSKESVSPDSQQNSSIQYKVNGQSITIDNIDSDQYVIFAKRLKGSLFSETNYQFNGQKGLNNLLSFSLVTDSLHETVYHYDSTAANKAFVLFNGNESALFYSGDYFDINITSYKTGRVSGTFTAKFSPVLNYNQRSSISITEGKINNVQVIY